VLALPILVDLLLWVGPHVSYSPLVDPQVTRATEWVQQANTGPRRVPRNAEVATSVEEVRQWLIARTGETNVLSLVARGPIALPSIADVPSSRRDVAFVSDWGSGLGLLFGLLVSGLLLGGCFYGGLAAASSGQPTNPLRIGRRAPLQVVRVLGLLAAVIGISLLLGLPVFLVIGFAAAIAPAIATLGLVLVGFAMLFGAIHLSFALSAIFVSDVGPLGAIQRSVSVVRRNLWSSIFLLFLSWLILAGMGRVWEVVASNVQQPYGIVLSILGHAYIASGLIAASMIFYTERVEVPPSPAVATAPSPS
jgi:hypothetical protein